MTMRTSNAVMGMTNEANRRLEFTTERLSALAGARGGGFWGEGDVWCHTSHVTLLSTGRVMVVRDANAVRVKIQDRMKVRAERV